MRARRRKDEPGRLKWKVAELLEALGFVLSPYDILEAKGYYRIGKYEEAYRWEAWGKAGTGTVPRSEGEGGGEGEGRVIAFVDETVPVHFASWDTLTECAKMGVTVYHEYGDLASQVGVAAKEESSVERSESIHGIRTT